MHNILQGSCLFCSRRRTKAVAPRREHRRFQGRSLASRRHIRSQYIYTLVTNTCLERRVHHTSWFVQKRCKLPYLKICCRQMTSLPPSTKQVRITSQQIQRKVLYLRAPPSAAGNCTMNKYPAEFPHIESIFRFNPTLHIKPRAHLHLDSLYTYTRMASGCRRTTRWRQTVGITTVEALPL